MQNAPLPTMPTATLRAVSGFCEVALSAIRACLIRSSGPMSERTRQHQRSKPGYSERTLEGLELLLKVGLGTLRARAHRLGLQWRNKGSGQSTSRGTRAAECGLTM